MSKQRLDKEMLARKLVLTRSQASMLIKQGDVLVNDVLAKTGGQLVSGQDQIIINQNLYVGRGAYKLIKALDEFQINPESLVVADFGASTGGFTQVLLERNASKVYAIDVGHNQLAALLKNDTRVVELSGVNIKNGLELEEKVDLAVCDLSFISLKQVLNNMMSCLKKESFLIALIKPQFEAGKELIGKSGIVAEGHHRLVLKQVEEYILACGHHIIRLIESPILGKQGNKEYLALIQ